MPILNVAQPIGAWTTGQINEAFNEIRRAFVPLISEREAASKLRLRSSMGEAYDITVGSLGGLEVRTSAGSLVPTVVGSVSLASTAVTAQSAGSLTQARTINATGDVTGSVTTTFSGTVEIPLILSGSGVTAGTYERVVVDAKGRVTNGSNPIPSREHLRSTIPGSSQVWVEMPLDNGYLGYEFEFIGTCPNALNGLIYQLSTDNGSTWIEAANTYANEITGNLGASSALNNYGLISYTQQANGAAGMRAFVVLNYPAQFPGHHILHTIGGAAAATQWGVYQTLSGTTSPVAKANRIRFAYINTSFVNQGVIIQRGIRAT